MLTFPEVLSHQGIVVYPDDEDCNLFYPLQGVPHLRMDAGVPVFRAVFWTDDATGPAASSGAVAGLRGALLNFDVDLAIPTDVLNQVREQIERSGVREQRQRAIERQERERADRLARARGEGVSTASLNIPELGPVRFGSMRVTDGKVVLLTEQGGGFVEWASAGGPPSMIGTNNAAFALRLGAEGAAVWHGALLQDAASIGVRFELEFEARLPSLEIHIWAGSTQSLDVERVYARVVEKHDDGCDENETSRYETTELTETLQEEGLINIEIIKGSAQVSEEHVSKLRSVAIDMMAEKIKEILKSKLSLLSDADRKNSLINVMKQQVNSFAELRLSQRDVITWNAAPQATIASFFKGISQTDRESLMTVVDLANPVVQTLEIEVTAIAEWDADPRIAQVRVSVNYRRSTVQPVKEVLLTKAKPTETLFWRREGRGGEDVTYEAEAFIVGSAQPIRLASGRTNGKIVISLPRLGRFQATFRPHPDTFQGRGSAKITGVEVAYTYKTPGEPDHRSGSIMLVADNLLTGQVIDETTFREINAPLVVSATYFRDGDQPVRLEGTRDLWMPNGIGQMTMPSPWAHKIDVSVQARRIENLARITLELEHSDPASGFRSDAAVMLDEAVEWQASGSLPTPDEHAEKFRWRYTVVGLDDQMVRGPWVDAEGDQALLLPVMAVKLRTQLLDLGGAFAAAIVRLTYRDDMAGFRASHEFFLSAPGQDPMWLIPRTDPNRSTYDVELTLIRTDDGSEVVAPLASHDGANLILRPPA